MIHFILLVNKLGKIRLNRTYTTTHAQSTPTEIIDLVLDRSSSNSNIIEYSANNLKLIYKKYASLYFVVGVDAWENELIILQAIHRYVELLDAAFGNVCELDIVFNHERANWLLNDLVLGGHLLETAL